MEVVAEVAHKTDRAVSFRHRVEIENEDTNSKALVNLTHTTWYINRLRVEVGYHGGVCWLFGTDK